MNVNHADGQRLAKSMENKVESFAIKHSIQCSDLKMETSFAMTICQKHAKKTPLGRPLSPATAPIPGIEGGLWCSKSTQCANV